MPHIPVRVEDENAGGEIRVFCGRKDDGDEAEMMEELKIQFYAVFQTALICFDLSFSNSRFWSVKFLLSVAKEKKEKGDKKPWCCWDEKAKCRSGTVFQTKVKWRRKKINWGRRKCQRRSENLVGKEGRIHRGQLSVFSFLCLLSHICVMSRLLGKSAFLLFLFVPFEPRFHEQFTQPYLQQAKLLMVKYPP